MRLFELVLTLLCLWLFAAAVSGQEAATRFGLVDCASRLELPLYHPLARQARLSGTVVAIVQLDNDGGISRLELEAPGVHGLLKDAVSASVRQSTFSRKCDSKKLQIIFTFVIEGDATPGATQSLIAFAPPNRFIIRTRPAVPMPE